MICPTVGGPSQPVTDLSSQVTPLIIHLPERDHQR